MPANVISLPKPHAHCPLERGKVDCDAPSCRTQAGLRTHAAGTWCVICWVCDCCQVCQPRPCGDPKRCERRCRCLGELGDGGDLG